jgi:hypothetical protein
MMTSKSKMVSAQCGKCSGRGRLSWAAHVEGGVCFWCNGSGQLMVPDGTFDGDLIPEDNSEIESDYCQIIYSGGIVAAREIFKSNRTNKRNLECLVGAMRENGYIEESNAVVRHMRELEWSRQAA